MKKLRQKQGITLIALIITIIVMLILVGVTVTVALNGGLFSTAKQGASQTEIEAERESLYSAVVGAIGKDAKVDFAKLNSSLPSGWSKQEDGTYKSPDGNIYTVTNRGTIGTGSGWVDNGNGSFTKGSTTVEAGKTTYTSAEVQQKLGVTVGEGKYSGTWTVIGVEGDKIKLISTTNVAENVTLGNEDPGAITAVPSQGETPTLTEFYKRSAWSYTHAVDTLDKAAATGTGFPEDKVRSITLEDMESALGITDADKGNDYNTKWKYYYDETAQKIYYKKLNGENWTTGESFVDKTSLSYIDETGELVTIDSNNYKNSDETLIEANLTWDSYAYSLTSEQKEKYKNNLASSNYWIAGTTTTCGSEYIGFNLHELFLIPGNGPTMISSKSILHRDGSGSGTNAVRAIVYI